MSKYKVLEVGQVYKSYRQVAEILGEDVKTGNARNAQIKEWDCHFKYSKDGNKFVIEEIYEESKEKLDFRKDGLNKIKYVEFIERLILDLLLKQEGNNLIISKNRLYQELKMVNKNYSKYKNDKKTICQQLLISKDELDDFYLASDGMLKRNLETALNNLGKKSLIDFPLLLTVAIADSEDEMKLYRRHNIQMTERENEYGDIAREFEIEKSKVEITHRIATSDERSHILREERSVMQQFNCREIRDVYKRGLSASFYKKVNRNLFKSLNIIGYYYSYDISFTKEDVEDELEFLGEKEKIDLELKLNDNIKFQLNKNIMSKNKLAPQKYEKTQDEKYKIRMSDSYVKNGQNLVNSLIDTECKEN